MRTFILLAIVPIILCVLKIGPTHEPVGLDILIIQPTLDLVEHEPIHIMGDDEFEGWPGIGTKDNPYVLSNLSIDSSRNNAISGIKVEHTSVHFLIENCLIKGVGPRHAGIFFGDVQNGWVRNNEIQNATRGIMIYDHSSYNILEDNTIENTVEGIFLNVECNNNIIRHNTISQSSDTTILVLQSYHNLIEGNIGTNSESGSRLVDSDNNTVRTNIFKDNVVGMYVHDHSAYNIIKGNKLSNLDYLGISNFENASYNSYQDNNIWNTRDAGLVLRGGEGSIIKGNFIKDCRSNGLEAFNAVNVTISGNQVVQNRIGVHIQNSTKVSVSNNVVKTNSESGISLDQSYSISLFGNDIDNNIGHGIEAHNSNGFVMEYNSIENSGLSGVTLEKVVDGRLTQNNITRSGTYGIRVIHSSASLVFLNSLRGNNNGHTQGFIEGWGVSWSNGTHGNYWSDHKHLYNETNGICNIIYVLEGNGTDPHPLAHEYTWFVAPNLGKMPNLSNNILSGVTTTTTIAGNSGGEQRSTPFGDLVWLTAGLIFLTTQSKREKRRKCTLL